MNEDSHFFSLGKIKGKNGILAAMRHNKRELPKADHIDSSRSHLNYSLVNESSPEQVAEYAKTLLASELTKTLRKDAVMAVEILFSLPSSRHNQDNRYFFEDCHKWVLENISGRLLAFDVHLDESAPHAHAVILPLVNGLMIGSKIVGNITNLNNLRHKFMEAVGKKHALFHRKIIKLSKAEERELASIILSKLKNDITAIDCVWPAIEQAVMNNPAPYARLLSIEQPTKRSKKSFVDHLRQRGRGTFVR